MTAVEVVRSESLDELAAVLKYKGIKSAVEEEVALRRAALDDLANRDPMNSDVWKGMRPELPQ